MRTTIILPRDYEGQFVYEARKCGLATKIDIPGPNAFSSVQEDALDQALYFHYGARKQKIFQMVLLFDEIIIPAIDPTNDYSQLQKSGYFNISSLDDYMHYAQKNKLYDDCIADSLYLKHALLPVLNKRLTSFYDNDIKTISKRRFAENLYDAFFASKATGNIQLSPDMKKAVDLVIARKKRQRELHYSIHNIEYDDYLTNNALLFYEIWENIASEYEYLCMLLEMAYERNAYFINCEYRLDKIGCEKTDMSYMLDDYATICIECQDIIRMLPKPTSLIDVIRIKESKEKEIRRLRQILSEFESTVRSSGKADAIKSVRHDAQLAVKDLNQGISSLTKVGKWTTMLSVPIAIAEDLLHMHPFVGVTVGTVGMMALIQTEIKKRNSGWINILR